MVKSRFLIRLSVPLLFLMNSCGPGTPEAPPFVPLAEYLATDSRFTFNGTDVTDDRIVAEAGSNHVFAASTRLLEPDLYKDGVRCRLRIVGVNHEGEVLTHGHKLATVKPDLDGRVSLEGKLPIPLRRGEYEIQIEVYEKKVHLPVGRVPLIVNASK